VSLTYLLCGALTKCNGVMWGCGMIYGKGRRDGLWQFGKCSSSSAMSRARVTATVWQTNKQTNKQTKPGGGRADIGWF